jgi:uncharacterized repeat protein (TIGR01451 family)
MNTRNTQIWKAVSVLVLLTTLAPAALFLGPVPMARAADSGWRSPTANTAALDTGGDGNGFERNPDRAYADNADDSSYAESRDTCGTGGCTERHRFYNYGLSIPSDATIQGIEVRLDWWLDNLTGSNSISVDLSWNGGTGWTTLLTDTVESTSQRTVYLGGTSNTWGRTWSPSEFSDANFRVRVNINTDQANARRFYLDWVPVRVTYITPPGLIAPANGSATNNQRPTFDWSSVTGTGITYHIQVDDDSGFASPAIDQSGLTNTDYTPGADLAPGVYYWRVRTFDGSTPSNWSPTWSFTIDTGMPQSQASSLAYANAAFTVSAINVSDPGTPFTGVAGVRLYYRLSTGTWAPWQSEDTSAPYQWTFTPPDGTNGTYFFQTVARDNVGNSELVPSGSVGQGDSTTIFDNVAPASAATSPAYANASPFAVSATASDDTGSGVANVRLYFRGPTGNWAQTGTTITFPGPYQWNFTPGANGTYYFQSVACDAVNNCETPLSGGTGIGDTTTVYDSVAPTSSATPPAGPLNYGTIPIPWMASDATSGLIANGVTLWYKIGTGGTWTADGSSTNAAGVTSASGEFEYTPASDGTYCFQTVAADRAGNVEAGPSGNGDGCTIYKAHGSISGRVWLDADGNGALNGAESGINGVLVTLSGGATATTAGGGLYQFSGLQGAQSVNVADDFGSVSYSNNDGTRNWAGDWSEFDTKGGGPGAGNIWITGGQLRLDGDADTYDNSLSRMVNLAGSIFANLSFDLSTSGNLDPEDTYAVEVSNNGGASYTTLGSYANDANGPQSYSLSAYMAANTIIRFRITCVTFQKDEYFQVDNVDIQFQDTSQSTYTVTVAPSNFNPGGPLNGLNATSNPASPLAVTLGVAQDVPSVDFGYGAFAIVGDLVYHDIDRSGGFNPGEPGIPNITVWLYNDSDGNGRIDGADSILRIASTDANGLYALRGVSPGNYTVLADVNDPDLPAAFRPTSPNPVAVPNVTGLNTYNNADIGFTPPPPVIKPLYLHRLLNDTIYMDRIMPNGPDSSHDINTGTWHTWALTPALADRLGLVPGAMLTVTLHIDIGSDNQNLFVRLHRTADPNSGSFFDYTYSFGQSGLQLLVLTGSVPSNIAPFNAGDQIYLSLRKATKKSIWSVFQNASKVELPTYSYINVVSAGTYDAAYPGGGRTSTFIQGDTVYMRATASDPFGAYDINGMTVSVPGVFTNTAMTPVATGSLTRTFEIARPGLFNSNYSYTVTAAEGSEGQVTAIMTGTFEIIVSDLGNSTKTVDKAIAVPGNTLTYTIELSNTGGLVANVRMTDTLPANVTYLSGPTGSGNASYSAGLNAVLYNGTVPANGRVTFTYRVTVNTPLDNGTVIANNTTINDGYTRFDTSPPATTVIQSAPNLSASTKAVDRATAAPGDALLYTILLTNTGNMNAYISSSDPLRDDIPANTAFDGGLFASDGQISFNPGFNRMEWHGTVPAGSSITLRFRAKIAWPLDNGTLITNTAVINEGAGFTNPLTYQRTATTTIVSAPIFNQSIKVVDKTLAAPGDGLGYTIILRNSGNMNAPGVVLTDVLPANLTWAGDAFLSATSGNVQYISTTRTMQWDGDVNAGMTVQILFRATVNSPLPNNTPIVNTARVHDGVGNFTPFNLSALTTIQSTPNLNSSTKVVDRATAAPGTTLFYTITLVNTGNAVANASFVDTLPSQLQNPALVSWSSGQAQVVGTQITWTGAVTPTQNVVIVFRAALLLVLDNGTVVQNTALVNDGVNTAFYLAPPAVTTVQSSPDLNTSLKVVDRATASPNDLLVYTIRLTNTGNMVAHSVLVRDVLPANVTLSGGLSASPGQPLPTYSSINNRVTWQGDVAPGALITVSYQVRVNTPLDSGTVILNDAEISDGVHTPFDTAPPAQTTITSAPILTTSSKSVDLATAAPGNLLHYTLRLVNTGNMIATGVSLSDTIPAEVTFASGPFVTGGGSGGWNPGQRRVFWSGSVAPGSDVTVEYYVTVNNPLPNNTTIVNDAVVQGSFGTVTTNQVSTIVSSDHQLAVTKSAPSAIGAGQRMTYTIAYNVTSNEPAPGVIITDTVPANTTYVSCTGGCVQSGGMVTWTLGNLVPGNSGSMLLIVQVTSPLPDGTLIHNAATISDAENAPTSGSVTTTVTSGHGFSLAKRDTGYDPVQAGGTLVYSLDWSVAGTAVAQSVTITDVLPANTTFVSCGGATCAQAGGMVTWTLGDRNPGSSGTITVSVSVASPLPNGTLLINYARIYDTNGGLPTTASEQTTVQSSHSLSITKTGPANVQAGAQITYTINWSVSGNEMALGLAIEDSTPANTTFASASGAGTIENPGPGNGGLVRWRLGDQAPGAAGVVTLVVNVASPLPNGTLINNTATIADTNGGATRSSSWPTTVNSSHGFTLTKSDTPDPVSPNGLINYTIHWQVTGNEAAHNIVITDALPLHTTYATCGACVLMGDYVRWDIGDRNPGASGDAFLQVRVDTPLVTGTLIVNNARISDGNNGTPVQTTINTTVQSSHQLGLTKGAPSVVQAGQPLTYTINWSVTGDEPAFGVTITDAVPANTTYADCGPAGACSVAGSIVTWALGDLVPGNSGSATFVVTTGSLLPNGTPITNTARIFDNAGRRAQATALTTVSSGHGYTLAKRDTGYDPAQAGSRVVYSIDWTMAGTEVAQNVVITDAIPANTVFAGCSGATCSYSGGMVTWNLGNQNPNALGTVNVAVTVTSPLPNGTLLTDNARISDSNGGLPTTASEQTTVQAAHTLNVQKSAPASVAAGGQILYTMAWSVSGNETAQNLVMEDTTPANTTYASSTPVANDHPPAGSTGLVRWRLGNQPPGASGVVTLVVNVVSPLPNGTPINNTATIADSNNGVSGSDSATTQVNSSHSFILTKSDTPDPVSPDGLINYTMHWQVTGNEAAQSIIITDAIPANTTYQTCGACVLMGDYVRWDLGDRNPGASGDAFLQVRVSTPLVSGTLILNNAHISDANSGTPVAASASTTANSNHQLTLSKTAPGTIQAGQVLNYSIAWSVTGNEPAPTVTITDAVPANTAFASCGGATCSLAGGVVTWDLGNLVPGNSGIATLAVTVTSPLPNGTVISNTAHLLDATNRRAQSSASTTVTSGHGFSLVKRDTGYDPVQAGGTLVYSLNWSLSGNEAAQAVVITDTLPINTTYASCGGATCSLAGGAVTWTVGNQGIGASGTVTVAVTVANPLPNGTILTNNARIYDGNGGLPATATEQTTVNSSHTLNITKTGPANVAAGGRITYTMAWSVTGNEAAQNVVIDDTTPGNTTFASASGAATIEAPPAGSTGLVRWRLGTQASASGVVTLVVNVNSPLPNGTLINNSASIADSNGGTPRTSSWNTTVNSSHSFVLTKSDTPDPTTPNGIINYTVHWEVRGNEVAQSVVITDGIPANTSFSSCGACVLQGSYVSWDLGNRNPGASGDVFLQVRVNTPLTNGTVINNLARISDSNGATSVVATASTTVQSDHQLALSKSAPSIVQAGQPLAYTLNWSVTGDEPAAGVTITDVVPANTTFVSCTGGCTQAGGVLTWNLGNRVPGNSGTVSFMVTVGSLLPNGTVMDNSARIYDAANRSAVATASTTVSSGHGFTLAKRDTGYDPVQAGATLVYAIDWSMAGTEVAQSAIITDALPANTTYVSCAGGVSCGQAGGVVTWNLGNLNPNASGTVTLTLTVASPLPNGTLLNNTARISDGNGGLPTTASQQTTVQSSHTLNITKTGPANVAAGGQITYTIAYSVTGNETALNVLIDDTTPPNTTFARASGAPTIDNPGAGNTGLVRWHLGNLAPGANGTVILVVNVNSPLPNGTLINNSATIVDANGGTSGSSSTSTTVTSGHAFTLTKSGTPDPVTPGGILNYTIHWELAGNGMAQGIIITDAIPANTSFWSCGGCSVQNGVARWNLGSRNPGDAGDVTLQVLVNTPLPNGTLIVNTARIYDNNNGVTASATATTNVMSDHNLTIKKTAPAAVGAGSQIVYTIDYVVSGSELAPGVVITDAIPTGTTYMAASCQPAAICSLAGDVLTWTLGDLVPGSSGTVQFTVRADAALPNGTQIVNTAYIHDDAGKTAASSTITRVGSEAQISLTDNRTTIQPGEPITYTIRYGGVEPLNNGRIQISVPANTTFVTADGDCARAGNTVYWLLLPQPPGFSDQRTIVVRLDPVLDNGTIVSTTAYLLGDGQGSSATDDVVVVSAPSWATSAKTADRYTVEPASRFTYTIYLTNTGTMHAHATTLTDTLPSQVTYADGSATSNSGAVQYDAATGSILWSGAVDANSVVTITFAVTVNADVPLGTPIENYAYVGDEVNASTALPPCTVSTVAPPPRRYYIYLPLVSRNHGGPQLPDLVVTGISVTPANPSAGQAVDLAVTIKNQGNAATPACFWIDLYINPTQLPITINKGWFEAGSEGGLVWAACGLDAGQSVTLHYGDTYYRPAYSQFDGRFTSPLTYTLYAQVDSWNPSTDYGAVYESSEQNNVYGPYSVSVGGVGGAERVTGAPGAPEAPVPPTRPDIPPAD